MKLFQFTTAFLYFLSWTWCSFAVEASFQDRQHNFLRLPAISHHLSKEAYSWKNKTVLDSNREYIKNKAKIDAVYPLAMRFYQQWIEAEISVESFERGKLEKEAFFATCDGTLLYLNDKEDAALIGYYIGSMNDIEKGKFIDEYIIAADKDQYIADAKARVLVQMNLNVEVVITEISNRFGAPFREGCKNKIAIPTFAKTKSSIQYMLFLASMNGHQKEMFVGALAKLKDTDPFDFGYFVVEIEKALTYHANVFHSNLGRRTADYKRMKGVIDALPKNQQTIFYAKAPSFVCDADFNALAHQVLSDYEQTRATFQCNWGATCIPQQFTSACRQQMNLHNQCDAPEFASKLNEFLEIVDPEMYYPLLILNEKQATLEGGRILNLMPSYSKYISVSTAKGWNDRNTPYTLSQLFDQFYFNAEMIDGYKDPITGNIVNVPFSEKMIHYPPVLAIRLLREKPMINDRNQFAYEKCPNQIEIPMDIDMGKYARHERIDAEQYGVRKNIYRLASFIVHLVVAGGGHYFSYACDYDGNWAEYNDSSARPISSIRDVLKQYAKDITFVHYVRISDWEWVFHPESHLYSVFIKHMKEDVETQTVALVEGAVDWGQYKLYLNRLPTLSFFPTKKESTEYIRVFNKVKEYCDASILAMDLKSAFDPALKTIYVDQLKELAEEADINLATIEGMYVVPTKCLMATIPQCSDNKVRWLLNCRVNNVNDPLLTTFVKQDYVVSLGHSHHVMAVAEESLLENEKCIDGARRFLVQNADKVGKDS